MKSSNRFVALVATLMVLVPVAVSASDSFTDVADSDVFHNDIDWLAQADVTRGCNPPANDRFCPKDFVTREQMAAFMHRLAGNEVVDAADSQLLDGLDSAAFLQTNEDAANSDLLDGLDSSDFPDPPSKSPHPSRCPTAPGSSRSPSMPSMTTAPSMGGSD